MWGCCAELDFFSCENPFAKCGPPPQSPNADPMHEVMNQGGGETCSPTSMSWQYRFEDAPGIGISMDLGGQAPPLDLGCWVLEDNFSPFCMDFPYSKINLADRLLMRPHQ
jgi:hypothetical protein